MRISSADLINIRNMTKAFKTMNVILYNSVLYTLPSEPYISYTAPIHLEDPMLCMKYEARELSKFVDDIGIVTEFDNPNNIFVNEKCNILKLYPLSMMECNGITNKLNTIQQYNIVTVPRHDVTEELREYFSMRKGDGCMYFKKDGYFISLPPTLLKVNKPDSVEMEILEKNDNTFLVRYITNKPKGIYINTYINYIKV